MNRGRSKQLKIPIKAVVINSRAKNYAKSFASQHNISPLGTSINMVFDALDFQSSDEEKRMKREMI